MLYGQNNFFFLIKKFVNFIETFWDRILVGSVNLGIRLLTKVNCFNN